jgi:YggT family protein
MIITSLFRLASYVVWIYMWIIILAAVYSMLAAFGVLDTRNRLVWSIGDFFYRATDPVLRPIRNLLPNLGGIDISPWIVVLLIQFVVLPLLSGVYGVIRYGNWQGLMF